MHSRFSDPLGIARVLEPVGAVPQQASVLRAGAPYAADELVVEVHRLCIDAASFRQLREASDSPEQLLQRVVDIVRARGKLHNPVTNSGGMLIGTVLSVGALHPDATSLRPGQRIATLASLTLTPLVLDELRELSFQGHQVSARGTAVVFATAPYICIPNDLDERLVLAAMDVCGAAPLALRWSEGRRTAVVLGAGMSGVLISQALQRRGLFVTIVDVDPAKVREVELAGLADAAVVHDARDACGLLERVGAPVGLVVCAVDVPGTEAGAILAAEPGGVVIFFSMATQFQSAALLAEGLGRDVTMLIGSGFVPGHAEATLDQIRRDSRLRELLELRLGVLKPSSPPEGG